MLDNNVCMDDIVRFAEKAHSNQRYDEFPYTKHLEDVNNVLSRFGFHQEAHDFLHAAAWLHDVIEDTGHSYNDVKKIAGEEVADLVYCVTNELGKNRKERNEKTYPKIAQNKWAVVLKLADRIANVENCIANKSGVGQAYKKEYYSFHSSLYNEEHYIDDMWNYLGELIDQL
jgi:(p)ppGpp synthase/HD superfamily hydrolase